ncbi:ABC transporter permease [Streptomyces sp. UNOC14_S4]|uniref:ABC transporter permease n=1 Tax=Streptomyces sp. UNOC14_S4 TaxID=2872340 RepID=UPI001E364B10|nr:ABC transporter permease [Streptomyces sp. UNOC14_S4]MCC3768561.1 ABC transporter permease [Streptomyces sp. UNOC14_S4]
MTVTDEVIRTAVPVPPPATRGLTGELRAVRVVWQREMLRFLRNRSLIAVNLLQPVFTLLVLGTGLSTMVSTPAGTSDYRAYLFPGVLMMTVQLPAIAAGASIVWDCETGFLREMLVAPVRRGSLLLGKCVGGATVATCQGLVVIGLAWTAHVPYRPVLIATLVGELALTALTMTALGTLAAVCITRMQTFQAVLSFTLTPMLFLSGAMFPLAALPTWLTALCLANPLTYAVDLLRQAVAAHAPVPAAAATDTWPAGWRPSTAAELAITATIGLTALAVAARRFSRPR